jgi:hypothetical protein
MANIGQIAQRCLWCGNNGFISNEGKKSDFDKNIFFKNGFNPICKKCKSKIIDIDTFKTYIQDSGIYFDENTWEKAVNDIRERLLKQYKNKNELPNDFIKLSFNKIMNRFFSLGNLSGDFKFMPLNSENKNKKIDKKDEIKIFNEKWMGNYTKYEIEYLENYLQGLHNDFKIVTTNHKDYAMKIAQASLHMNKCYQDLLDGTGGSDARYKTARENFDTLSKSAQFAESGRGQNDVSLGCFGVTFDKVEKKQWVPKHIPLEQDEFDKMLSQFDSIEESL